MAKIDLHVKNWKPSICCNCLKDFTLSYVSCGGDGKEKQQIYLFILKLNLYKILLIIIIFKKLLFIFNKNK